MLKRFIVTIALILTAGLAAILLSFADKNMKNNIINEDFDSEIRENRVIVPPKIVYEKDNIESEREEPSEPVDIQPKIQYFIREYEGKIAVFYGSKNTPEMVFNAPVKLLPGEDRELIKKGIAFDSYEKLVKTLEDYIS